MNCPVCLKQQQRQCSWCHNCLLSCFSYMGVLNCVGWVTEPYHFPEAVEEAKRMYTTSDFDRWKRLVKVPLESIEEEDPFQFSMLADWLADNNCPLQEAAVRALLEG